MRSSHDWLHWRAARQRRVGDVSAPAQRVAILVEDLFDHIELERAARRADRGRRPVVRSDRWPEGLHRQARRRRCRRLAAGAVRVDDVDAVVIPGGYAPDKMRLRHAMVDLVRDCMAAGKPVAAICHGPSVLINAKS